MDTPQTPKQLDENEAPHQNKKHLLIALLIFGGAIIILLGLFVTQPGGLFVQRADNNQPSTPPTGQISTDAKTTDPKALAPTYKKFTPGTTWQWQISGALNYTALDASKNKKKMYDIDMENASANAIKKLKAKGIAVICYMEVGAWESYRSDASKFPASVKGKALDPPYNEERYLDIRSTTVKNLMLKRLDAAKKKGCQGIEPDIDDAYFEDFNGNYSRTSTYTGFPITYSTQVNYNKYLAKAAHARGMAYGLKNGADAKFVKSMLSSIDFVLNEQCFEYDECNVYKPVIAAGKAVFHVEYSSSTSAFCPVTNALNFDSIKKNTSLGAKPRTACRNG